MLWSYHLIPLDGCFAWNSSTKFLYTFLIFHILSICPSHWEFLYFAALTILRGLYKFTTTLLNNVLNIFLGPEVDTASFKQSTANPRFECCKQACLQSCRYCINFYSVHGMDEKWMLYVYDNHDMKRRRWMWIFAYGFPWCGRIVGHINNVWLYIRPHQLPTASHVTKMRQ